MVAFSSGTGSFFVFIIYSFCLPKYSLQGAHEKRLLNHLLGRYNTLERPVANENEPLKLSFGLTLMQLIDVDERNQILTANVWLNLEWTDANLQWNESLFGNVKDLRIPPDRIWRPDVLLFNSANERFDSTYSTNVVVKSNGQCSFIPPGIFRSSCQMDITWFPFDEQKCNLKFGSWTYNANQIDLQLQSEDGGDIGSYIKSGEWQLQGVPASRSLDWFGEDPYIEIVFIVHIQRRTLYYLFNLIVPCVLIASMGILGFILPPNSGEKLSLGVTILLSLTLFLNMVMEIMPVTSDAVPLLGIYFNSIMLMVACSVVATIAVLNYHHRSSDTHEPMSNLFRVVFLNWMPWLLRMHRPGEKICLRSLSQQAKITEQLEATEKDVAIDDNASPIALPRQLYPRHGRMQISGQDAVVAANMQNSCLRAQNMEVLWKIIKEIRVIAKKVEDDDEAESISQEWMFAAMVVDRFCLIFLTLFTIIATICVLTAAPHPFTP